MAYYSRDSVDDFDEYDPTPYGGGYDQAVVYGKPRPPSEETCYPPARPSDYSSSSGFSYGSEKSPYGGAQQLDEDRPTYGSGSTHSYGGGSVHSYEGGSAYGRPKPQPQPAYDFQPDAPDPYADQYSEKPRPPHRFAGEEEYGRYQYGQQEPQQQYGGRWNKNEEYPPAGYGEERTEAWKPSYQQQEPQQQYGGQWNKNEEYPSAGYGEERTEAWKPSYQQQAEEPSSFERPSSYRPDQEEGYQRPQYEGYGYEEQRHGQHHHHHHRHHKNYDDE